MKGMGLMGKSMLFLLVPLIVFLAIGALFSIKQLDSLSKILIEGGTATVTRMAEQQVAQHARAVAAQVRLYLMIHPELKKEKFNTDPDFKKIAVQRVGLTGYSALYELPDRNGVWRTWAHVNPKIIGIDMRDVKKALGESFPAFWKVFTGVKGGKESRGYYKWRDADGKLRDKFMVCTPVKGTRFIVASTTSLDEFTHPMKKLQERSRQMTQGTRNIIIALQVATIAIIGLIVFFYVRSLIARIAHLSEVADRISVGELDMEIDVRSKDELGVLAQSIVRMQRSIRLAIERVRRRR